jgi:hypothetical protein
LDPSPWCPRNLFKLSCKACNLESSILVVAVVAVADADATAAGYTVYTDRSIPSCSLFVVLVLVFDFVRTKSFHFFVVVISALRAQFRAVHNSRFVTVTKVLSQRRKPLPTAGLKQSLLLYGCLRGALCGCDHGDCVGVCV